MEHQTRSGPATGFTLVELLVVVALIAVMSAVALPNLLSFIRNYTIETAAKELASEISTARYRAISRNANLGVLFVVTDGQGYRWVMEDDVDPQNAPNWSTSQGIDTLMGRPNQAGSRRQLPSGVQFLATGANGPAFRYNRFGAWCQPGVDNECPGLTGFAGTSFVTNAANGASVVITQPTTGLQRRLRVGTGGRVVIER